MEVTSKVLLSIHDFLPFKGSDENFGEVLIKFSEKTPPCSDTSEPYEITLRDFSILDSAFGALSVILALAFVRNGSTNAERTEFLLNHIAKIARNRNYQGRWRKVGWILSTTDLYSGGVYRIFEKIVRDIDSHEVYGNLLKLVALTIDRNLRFRKMYKSFNDSLSRRERLKGIKRKIRRRGYRDKGSPLPNKELSEEIRRDRWIEEDDERLRASWFSPQVKDPPRIFWFQNRFKDRS